MIVTFVFQTAIVCGVSFLIIYLLMKIGDFSKQTKKSLADIEKLKENSHRALNDIEKLKQSVKKSSPNIYENYWNKNKF